MSIGRLSSLQERILVVLADVSPGWTLAGGGALAGFLTQHRTTRDLDLFWRERAQLGDIPRVVEDVLRSHGLSVDVLQRTPAFCRLQVGDESDQVHLDLVADVVPIVSEPVEVHVAGATIRIDAPEELLAAKLAALLSRSELRDVRDVAVLLRSGGSLAAAVVGAARKDSSFSPLTLMWVLRAMPIATIAAVEGVAPEEVDVIESERDAIVDALGTLASPGRDEGTAD